MCYKFFKNAGTDELEEQENGDCDPPQHPPKAYYFKILDKSRAFHPLKCFDT